MGKGRLWRLILGIGLSAVLLAIPLGNPIAHIELYYAAAAILLLALAWSLIRERHFEDRFLRKWAVRRNRPKVQSILIETGKSLIATFGILAFVRIVVEGSGFDVLLPGQGGALPAALAVLSAISGRLNVRSSEKRFQQLLIEREDCSG